MKSYQHSRPLVLLPLLLFLTLLLLTFINNKYNSLSKEDRVRTGNDAAKKNGGKQSSSSSSSSSSTAAPSSNSSSNSTSTDAPSSNSTAPAQPQTPQPQPQQPQDTTNEEPPAFTEAFEEEEVLEAVTMETKEIAPGVHMPVMSIGTGGLERENAFEIVTNWFSLGGTGIDTALNYNNLDQVHNAINDYEDARVGGSRKDLFLTTRIPKCDTTEAVVDYIETALRMLGTSYVDLLLIHSPRGGTPELCAETWRVLEYYYQENRTRAIGVSNFRRKHLEPLMDGVNVVPHVNQMRLNVLSKDVDTIKFCEEHGITIEAYSPLGRGGQDDVIHDPIVEQIATAHNVSTYQVALKWIVQHEGDWVLTFQSSSLEHQALDAQVFEKEFVLSPTEMKQLDQAGIPLN